MPSISGQTFASEVNGAQHLPHIGTDLCLQMAMKSYTLVKNRIKGCKKGTTKQTLQALSQGVALFLGHVSMDKYMFGLF